MSPRRIPLVWALLIGALTSFAALAPQTRYLAFSYPTNEITTNVVFGIETNGNVANPAGWNTLVIYPSMVSVITNGTTNLVVNAPVDISGNANFMVPFTIVPQQLFFRAYASNTFWRLSGLPSEVVSTDPLPSTLTLRIQ